MHQLWHWILWCLAALSHDPASLDAERARCAGAVNVAYAAIAQEPAPAPRREPEAAPAPDLPPLPPAAPCLQCSGTGRIYRSDGGWVRCPCQCPTGKCPPGAKR
jgi:hypothetical protein